MNILITLNTHYIYQLLVMLTSLIDSNPGVHFTVYIAHSSLTPQDFETINLHVDSNVCTVIGIQIDDDWLSNAPVTRRYPKEMYYRIFSAQFLPQTLDRILYLDPDLVVLRSLDALYHLDFQGNLLAAASHVVHEPLDSLNRARLKMPDDSTYVNSGVLMLNLTLFRGQQNSEEVFQYIEDNKYRLFLPDQDVINGVYGDRTLALDPKIYNLDERYVRLYNLYPRNKAVKLDLQWIKSNTAIIHYCGRNKPWKDNYKGELDVFYHAYEQMLQDNYPLEKEISNELA